MTGKPITRYTFRKSARLSSRKDIKELFEKGSSFFLFPFKILYLPNPSDTAKSHQILISVPKKLYKSAVDRNRIKRRIREAYRLHQHIISDEESEKLMIAYIYAGKEALVYEEIESKLKKSLLRLKNKVLKKESPGLDMKSGSNR